MRLLAHDDVSYEWVDPHDWRVAEVRLLHPAGEVDDPPKTGNLLIQGDALHALTTLTSLPEISPDYVGKVKLCYIDPPFNTGQTFQHYDDAVEHSVWLTMLRDRLVQIKKLLTEDGSIWVHLDDVEQHRGRCVLDEIFGADNFIATIVWQKIYTRDNRKAISVSQDYIHVYAREAVAWKASRNLVPRDEHQLSDYKNPDNDPRGPWKSTPMTAQAGHGTAAQFYDITLPSGESIQPTKGTCWRFTKLRYEELVKDNRIWFGVKGTSRPSQKRFLSEVAHGLVPTSWWPQTEVGHNHESKKEIQELFPGIDPFLTPKPERLMERILQIASNPGDIVLDCFAGSGTTAAVAHKMGRRWVTVELSEHNVDTFVRPRLTKVVEGEDPGGITEAAGWEGGGGFREFVVSPSMLENVDGTVLLADWVTGGELAEAVAAQLGYTFEVDGPFAGRKGRSRLAVIDGMLTAGVADHLIGRLEERQTLLVVAQALEPGVEEHVRKQRSGSRARKVPRDLAIVGRLPSRLVRLDAKKGGDEDE
jgi:adenine-specific DNA-methyltransferase